MRAQPPCHGSLRLLVLLSSCSTLLPLCSGSTIFQVVQGYLQLTPPQGLLSCGCPGSLPHFTQVFTQLFHFPRGPHYYPGHLLSARPAGLFFFFMALDLCIMASLLAAASKFCECRDVLSPHPWDHCVTHYIPAWCLACCRCP